MPCASTMIRVRHGLSCALFVIDVGVTEIAPSRHIPWRDRPLDYAVDLCAARYARNGSRSIRADGRQPSSCRQLAYEQRRWSRPHPEELLARDLNTASVRDFIRQEVREALLAAGIPSRLQHQSRSDAVPLFVASTSDLCPALRDGTLIAGSYSSGLLNPRPRPPAPQTDGSKRGKTRGVGMIIRFSRRRESDSLRACRCPRILTVCRLPS